MSSNIGEGINSDNSSRDPWETPTLNSDGTRSKEYLASTEGMKELSIENDFDQAIAELDRKVAAGEMTEDEAIKKSESMLDSTVGEIDQVRQENQQKRASYQRLVDIIGQRAKSDDEIKARQDKVIDIAHSIHSAPEQSTQPNKPQTKEEILARIAAIDKEMSILNGGGVEGPKPTDAGTGNTEPTDPVGTEPTNTDDADTEPLDTAEKHSEQDQKLLNADFEVLEMRRKELAESYAKNRRLVVGKHRAELRYLEDRYGESLRRYLKDQAEITNRECEQKDGDAMEATREELAKDLESGKITAEEANAALEGKWQELLKARKSKVSVNYVKTYLKETEALKGQTEKQLDSKGPFRKMVSKFIDNPKIKKVLFVAGMAGLAVPVYGLVTGAVTMSLGAGSAVGALWGALSGAVMSRQSSRNSAIRRLANPEQIRKQLEGIDATNNQNVKNTVGWLLKQYTAAAEADRSSNRRRTLIATGLGAALGWVMSGVHLNKTIAPAEQGTKILTPTKTVTEHHVANLETISHAKGTGTQQFFRELSGTDGETYYSSGAHDILVNVLKKYNLSPDQNDLTFPGKISEWPSTARQAMSEVAEEWGKQGLVPVTTTIKHIIGQPVYDTTSKAAESLVASKLHNFFVSAGTVTAAGAMGDSIASGANKIKSAQTFPDVRDVNAAEEKIPSKYLFTTFEDATSGGSSSIAA